MGIIEDSLKMLEKYPLCDHCLGRQFGMLGYGLRNDERGKAIKQVLTFEAHVSALSKKKKGIETLRVLATNGFSESAKEILRKMNKQIRSKKLPTQCYLCEDKFAFIDELARKAVDFLKDYEYTNFLVGTELPLNVEEREDEFKAEFNLSHSENLRNEFGRSIGKKIAELNNKDVEFKKPEIVTLINPFTKTVKLQINPLFIAGRYKKLVRGIPQSKWFCSTCRGKGCEKCNWTGKMYPESVEELVEQPFLEAAKSEKAFFHASGREDIDARMLGQGRPFVVEISKPRKRFLNLGKLGKTVNAYAKGKVKISKLHFADKGTVRKLKKAESAQKEYRVSIEFENKVTAKDLRLLENRLKNITVKQETPNRVLHRRANLTREKYIYDVTIKKLSLKKAEMKIRCQGGLYVKELVSGDEGRTTPSVSELLKNKAKPIKLDVLNVIMKD
jgi:tRNA pseudouridine synthase 10